MKEEELQDDSLIYCEDCCEDVSPTEVVEDLEKEVWCYCPNCNAVLEIYDIEDDEFYI